MFLFVSFFPFASLYHTPWSLFISLSLRLYLSLYHYISLSFFISLCTIFLGLSLSLRLSLDQSIFLSFFISLCFTLSLYLSLSLLRLLIPIKTDLITNTTFSDILNIQQLILFEGFKNALKNLACKRILSANTNHDIVYQFRSITDMRSFETFSNIN